MPTYSLLDPFEFPYYFYRIRGELMMAQSRAESTRDSYNYGQYLNQFPPNTIKVIQEFERIQKRICRHKMSIMFNEICIYVHVDAYVRINMYMYKNIDGRMVTVVGNGHDDPTSNPW